MKILSFSNCGKNAIYHDVEKSFQKFQDSDPDESDFQKLIRSSLRTDTSVVKIFLKIRLVVFT